MKTLTLSLAGFALSAAPVLAQYPQAPAPYAPAPWGYPQPVRPVMWAPVPMVPVYYMPQPYVQVVPVPVAKVQAAGVMTREGIYPLEGYHPQLPIAQATASAKAPKELPPATKATASPAANSIQPTSATEPASGRWTNSFMPWLRPAQATTPSATVSGSVTGSLRNDLGAPSK